MSLLQQQQLMMAMGAPAVVQTTWDPVNKASDIVLESGNTVATSPSGTAGTGGTVVSASGKTAGKFYAEVLCTQLYSSWLSTGAGLHIGTASLSAYVGGDSNGWGTWGAGSGGDSRMTFHSASSANTTTVAANAGGEACRIAVDIDAGKLWLSYFGGTAWIGGGDPAAGTSPTFTFTAGSSCYLAATPRSSSGGASCTKLALVAPSSWANAAPAGFGVWT